MKKMKMKTNMISLRMLVRRVRRRSRLRRWERECTLQCVRRRRTRTR